MRKYLTIGELANLLNIATSNIRYYEKEGLVSPCKIDDNGYRLYDYSQLDKLESILLFRKLNIPLKQLKTIINNYSIDDYIEILNSSLSSIDSKIIELQNKKKYVSKNLNMLRDFKGLKTNYQILYIPERKLYCIQTGKIFEYTIKEMYEIMKSKNINYLDVTHDIYYINLDNENFTIGIPKTHETKNFEGYDTIILPKGTYLNYNTFIEDFEEFDIEETKFYDYLKKNKLVPIGKVISIENIRYSNFHLESINLNLQVLIKR
ncbi:MerR family transcriptional regulator [Clostridium sediminicola]|uniref:MerR family transcriptional regulator n=1 Tax=Clostridium sediminicola TaxID=3114879 RepID=UPI0031F27485